MGNPWPSSCHWFFTGFGSSGMDYGMVGGKETGTESRFKQWTSMMDGLPSVASQDANMHKNGERFQLTLSKMILQGIFILPLFASSEN